MLVKEVAKKNCDLACGFALFAILVSLSFVRRTAFIFQRRIREGHLS